MPRYTIVYPRDGGEPYLKGSRPDTSPRRTAILPDLPDFISPIDGQLYSGRAGLREHCKIHDVIPNADLAGLPTLTTNADQRSEEQRRADIAERKRLVIKEVNKHYY